MRSQRVVTAEGLRPACVIIEDGRILAVENSGIELGSMPVFDLKQLFVLPGLVDSHVHINAPGRSEWEGFGPASHAAAAGGYTCLIDMPLNCIPPTTNVAALEAKRRAAMDTCIVDYAFWGGAVEGNAKDLLPLAEAGVRGFKSFLVHSGVDEFSMIGEKDLRTAMLMIAGIGLPLLVHAEDPVVLSNVRTNISDDPRRYLNYLRSRPDEAERAAIELMVRLSRETGCRVHIVHLASAAALSNLRLARAAGLPVTVETCPHYLYFAAEEIPDGSTHFKCAPPIRSAANRELLWSALGENLIDMIATDHAPCPPAMKRLDEGDFFRAWPGIASLSVALPAMWTIASSRGFAITDIVRWMSERTADLAGIGSKKGRIAPGLDADLVIFDPDESFLVRTSDLYFRHPISPYLGERLTGRVKMTILRGTVVFEDGKFVDSCPGRQCNS